MRRRGPAPFLAEFDRLAEVVRVAQLRRLAVLDAPALELDGQAPELELLESVGLAELVSRRLAELARQAAAAARLVRLVLAVRLAGAWRRGRRRLSGLRRLAAAGWRHRAPVVVGVCLGVWASCLALLIGGWVAS